MSGCFFTVRNGAADAVNLALSFCCNLFDDVFVMKHGSSSGYLAKIARTVGKIVTVKATENRKIQQTSTIGLQLFQYQSLRINRFHPKQWNLVRDQGVGGSNPLSPTNLFNYLCVQPSYNLQSRTIWL